MIIWYMKDISNIIYMLIDFFVNGIAFALYQSNLRYMERPKGD